MNTFFPLCGGVVGGGEFGVGYHYPSLPGLKKGFGLEAVGSSFLGLLVCRFLGKFGSYGF